MSGNSQEAKPLVHGLLKDDLSTFCTEHGQAAFRASQVWTSLYAGRATDWKSVKNIQETLRLLLDETFSIQPVTEVKTAGDPAGTYKILVGLRDGERIEEVLIPSSRRCTVCISSQVGCKHKCAFCASGQSGFRRNLEAGEMVGQVLLAAHKSREPLTNVVFMGVGEPFDNYDAVLRAVRIINDKDGLNIGARRITISTSGVIPGIERLAGEGLQVELSVSLHAPVDDLRTKIMPVNRKYPLPALIEACGKYTAQTNRIVTFEYAMIRGVNDTARMARQLARLILPVRGRVNLIPLSAIDEYRQQSSSPEAIDLFMAVVKKEGVNVTLRASKGGGVNAACGQLRSAHDRK